MTNLILFINAFLSYFLVFAIVVILVVVACILGGKWKKISDAKKADKAEGSAMPDEIEIKE